MNYDVDSHGLRAQIKLSGAVWGITENANIEIETAQALLEILESCSKIVSGIYPMIMDAKDSESCWEAMEDFREEIRHIAYHIKDSKYLSIVLGSV